MAPEAKIWFPNHNEEAVRIILSHFGARILEGKKDNVVVNTDEQNLPPALMTEDGTKLYPIAPIAKLVGFSPEHVFKLVKEEKIRGLQPARDWFVSLEDLRNYRKSSETTDPKLMRKRELARKRQARYRERQRKSIK